DQPDFRMSTSGMPPFGGIYDAKHELPDGVTAHWITYFIVADSDAAAATITRLGGTVTESPKDTPFGRMGKALDSTGAPFAFIGMQQ
ncbi:MAG: glyoxalase, partial [Microbacteriaceae bacterium]|nr:glyoxalase [Microbacteriaceae bacterium]